MVEQRPVKATVAGSSPARGAIRLPLCSAGASQNRSAHGLRPVFLQRESRMSWVNKMSRQVQGFCVEYHSRILHSSTCASPWSSAQAGSALFTGAIRECSLTVFVKRGAIADIPENNGFAGIGVARAVGRNRCW